VTQLSLEQDALVGQSWWHERHGRCEVIAVSKLFPGWYRIQVRALGGHRRFQMEWPTNVVRGELASPTDLWVGSNTEGFVNATEHLRLADLGLVPLDPAIARAAGSGRSHSESSHGAASQTERTEMTVASPKKPAKGKSSLVSLSKTALRKKLLETVTISDSMWKAYREEHGLPEREPGETRETFIRRVLA
jgi:hypothetical protein